MFRPSADSPLILSASTTSGQSGVIQITTSGVHGPEAPALFSGVPAGAVITTMRVNSNGTPVVIGPGGYIDPYA